MFSFTKIAVGTMALLITSSVYADADAAHKYADTDNNGIISATEAVQALNRFGPVFGTTDTAADFDENGVVDFADLATLNSVLRTAGHSSVLNAYQYVDADGNLQVTQQESADALQKFGPMIGAIGKMQLAEDFDYSGKVDYADFGLLSLVVRASGHSAVINALQYADSDGNLVVTRAEFWTAYKMFMGVFGTTDSAADFDESGLVDFADFRYLLLFR